MKYLTNFLRSFIFSTYPLLGSEKAFDLRSKRLRLLKSIFFESAVVLNKSVVFEETFFMLLVFVSPIEAKAPGDVAKVKSFFCNKPS